MGFKSEFEKDVKNHLDLKKRIEAFLSQQFSESDMRLIKVENINGEVSVYVDEGNEELTKRVEKAIEGMEI